MALVTTAGAANADSYATLTQATDYFSARGIAAWTGSDTVKENALRRGTSYLDNQYRARWVGIRATEAQALAWPRVDGYRALGGGVTEPLYDADGFALAIDTVPARVVTATLEAALLALTGVSLEPRLVRGGDIKSIGKGVGPLRKDITYADGAPVVDRFVVIEGLLTGLVKNNPGATSGMVAIVRA